MGLSLKPRGRRTSAPIYIGAPQKRDRISLRIRTRLIHGVSGSGFGVAIGTAATLGFVVFGWDAGGRPPLSLGYVNAPGAVVMAVLTTAVAPWGAKLAHSLDRRVLRKAFALYLLATAVVVVVKAV